LRALGQLFRTTNSPRRPDRSRQHLDVSATMQHRAERAAFVADTGLLLFVCAKRAQPARQRLPPPRAGCIVPGHVSRRDAVRAIGRWPWARDATRDGAV